MKAVLLIALTASAVDAVAQNAETNAITAADDAFGVVIGTESIGLYSEEDVRGFNPLTAGNARLDGLYFDKQGPMTSRLVNDRRIRVGSSTLGFLWPAPTGIVDYMLRGAGADPSLTSVLYVGPFDVVGIDLDGAIPIAEGRGGLSAGFAYRDDEVIPGQTRKILSYGLIPEWNLSDSVRVQSFWGRRDVSDARTMPVVYVSDGQLPPRMDARYFGQDWTLGESYSEHYGALLSATPLDKWTVRAGVFQSTSATPRSYADLYLNTQADGEADHLFVAETDRRTTSTSGELRVTRQFNAGTLEHQLNVGVRMRRLRARYGGADTVEAGNALAGVRDLRERPQFTFGPQTIDHRDEWVGGLAYNLSRPGRLELSMGVQRASYERTVTQPTLTPAQSSDQRWLHNASFAWLPSKSLVLFGALTRGLEDSGVAPSSAVNRGEVLDTTRTSQEEAGFRYSLTPKLNLVVSGFDVRKPYFNFDTEGYFVRVGEERHRGVELSLAGEPVTGLTVVGGTVLMSPRVSNTQGDQDRIGKKPVGQTDRLIQLALDYRFAEFPAFSIDTTVINRGARVASLDGELLVPSVTTVDVGARYRFSFGRFPARLRAQVLNVFDEFSWYVVDSSGFQPFEPRRVQMYLSVDM